MNIIITGGGLGNKGAQSMLFIIVAALRKMFPYDTIKVLTLVTLDDSEFTFEACQISYYAIKAIKEKHPIFLQIRHLVQKKQMAYIEDIYKKARLQIDISGYALGSNWPYATVDYYLCCIECARKFSVPVYIMPQSFGPFNYSKTSRIMHRIIDTMSYPQFIYAREPDGFKVMTEMLGLNNVRQAVDMVLCCKSAEIRDVYRRFPDLNIPVLLPGSVAIIPNNRNCIIGEGDNANNYYRLAIKILCENGKNVYILSHSKEDANLCYSLKHEFQDNKNVYLLDRDFSCFEFEKLVSNFDFVIASRYHAIVHALKNSVPCIAVGWATKYRNLLSIMELGEFVYDVREEFDEKSFQTAVNIMCKSFTKYAVHVRSKITTFQDEKLLNFLSGNNKSPF